MSDSTIDIPTGQIAFLANLEPGLKDATYQLTISQAMSATDIPVPDRVQEFVISGPRFAIDPSEVHAQFPPPGASGQFADVLPHVVLGARLLPWERDIPLLDSSVPWLALLVFEEGELAGDPGDPAQVLANYATTMTVSALAATTGNVFVPALATISDEEEKMTCQVIRMSSALFAKVVPTALELPFLAHARAVDTSAKVAAAGADGGVFSVVVANRFPRSGSATAGARNIVHLVTLDGFGALLGGTAPQCPAQQEVLMVSLASWSFSCLADPAQTFGGLATNLAFLDAAGTAPRPAGSLALRVPGPSASGATGAAATVATRLASGFIAAGYHAPSGEEGFAWYRGPLTPVVPTAVPRAAPFLSSAAATIYDADTGVFDQSLATAWQCGRALALADQTYATTLMRLRQRAARLLDTLVVETTSSATLLRRPAHDAGFAAVIAQGIDALGTASTTSGLASAAPAARGSLGLSALALRDIAGTAAVRAQLADALDDDPDAKTVAAWIGRIQLLVGVPFTHLVPDARMLPTESIRFFFVDANWIAALTDGALQVGIGSSRDASVQSALSTRLEQMAASAALAFRTPATPLAPVAVTSGLLIRSALAAGWPGVAIIGTAASVPVPLLRMEHLAPDVILCLFNGVPDTITLTAPHEGLEFGVDEGQVATRTVSGSTVIEGPKVTIYDPDHPATSQPAIRDDGLRVLKLNVNLAYATTGTPETGTDLLSTLAATLEMAVSGLHPGLVALQMVKGPETIHFTSALTTSAPLPQVPA